LVVTAPDVWAIKERIQAILQNDTDLFTTTGEADKLRKILVGYTDTQTSVLPMAFITNAQRNRASTAVSVISNEWKAVNSVINLEIHIIVDGKNSAKLEERLDDFMKLVEETISENNQLEEPVGGGSPLVSSSIVQFGEHQDRGKSRQKYIISIKCLTTFGS
jgi:hypothetical protein